VVPTIKLLVHLLISKTKLFSHLFDGIFVKLLYHLSGNILSFFLELFFLEFFQEMFFNPWKNLIGRRFSLFTHFFEPSLRKVANCWRKRIR
jgi:hypothetical protein